MLAAIFSQVGMTIINSVLGQFLEAFKAYENKVISVEQLKDQLYAALASSIKDIEIAQADALAKTYTAFMGAMVQSRLIKIVWATVTLSQLAVLLWVEIGVSWLCFHLGDPKCWPSSGTTSEWAYLLVAACVGLGPVVLRSGPGAGSMVERLKGLTK